VEASRPRPRKRHARPGVPLRCSQRRKERPRAPRRNDSLRVASPRCVTPLSEVPAIEPIDAFRSTGAECDARACTECSSPSPFSSSSTRAPSQQRCTLPATPGRCTPRPDGVWVVETGVGGVNRSSLGYDRVNDRLDVVYYADFVGLRITALDLSSGTRTTFDTDHSGYDPGFELLDFAWNPAAASFLFTDHPGGFGSLSTDGVFSLIGRGGWPGITMVGDRLLGAGPDRALSEVDPGTGRGTKIIDVTSPSVPSNLFLTDIGSLATDPSTGQLYALIHLSNSEGPGPVAAGRSRSSTRPPAWPSRYRISAVRGRARCSSRPSSSSPSHLRGSSWVWA
jgi:hypothetical protein